MEITSFVDIDATPDQVWDALSNIESHVDWMMDAAAIRFTSQKRRGIGTAFECETRVGPFKTVDRMTVVTWNEPVEIGVRHEGLVSGTGSFRVATSGTMQRVSWSETLRFPPHFGGRIGERVAKPLLAAMWHRNLAHLKRTIESERAT